MGHLRLALHCVYTLPLRDHTVVKLLVNLKKHAEQDNKKLWTCDARIEFGGSTRDCQHTFERYCTFGESLELVDMVVPSCSLGLDDEVIGTFFQALTFNSTVTKLKLLKSTKVTNLLAQGLSVNNSLSFWILLEEQIQALGVNTSLSSLNLGSNAIGHGGANLLAQALRVNTSLSSLDLGSNSIGDEEANLLAQALRVNTSLYSLDLGSYSINDYGANVLAQALRVNPLFLL